MEVLDQWRSNLLIAQDNTIAATVETWIMEVDQTTHKVLEAILLMEAINNTADQTEITEEQIQAKAFTAQEAAVTRGVEIAIIAQNKVDFTVEVTAQDNNQVVIIISNNLNTITISEKE